MKANYDSICYACGGDITADKHDMARGYSGEWCHASSYVSRASGRVTCSEYIPHLLHTDAWSKLKHLRGATLRKAAMTLGVTVTRNGRYLGDKDVLKKAAASCPTPDRLTSAIGIATGKLAKTESTSLYEQVTTTTVQPGKSEAELLAAVKARLTPWLDEKGEEYVAKLDAEVHAITDSLDIRIDEALNSVHRTVLEVRTASGTTEIEGEVHDKFPHLLKMLGAGLNVWVAGPAGSGKTRAASDAAKALGCKFYFNGAIDSEYKLSGFVDAQGRVVSTAFREAWTHGGVYLFDEVDASMPGALLAFNAALSGDLADFPGEPDPTKKHPAFRCVGAANTWGFGGDAQYVGRSRLDAAFLDRFAFLPWDYDEVLEKKLAGPAGAAWCGMVQRARSIARNRGLKVVVSPRATFQGAKMLAVGFTVREAAEACVLSRLDKPSREALGPAFLSEASANVIERYK